ncbi:MAG: hypothetical protein WC465_00380 [Patescibacteria group bacterium]
MKRNVVLIGLCTLAITVLMAVPLPQHNATMPPQPNEIVLTTMMPAVASPPATAVITAIESMMSIIGPTNAQADVFDSIYCETAKEFNWARTAFNWLCLVSIYIETEYGDDGWLGDLP